MGLIIGATSISKGSYSFSASDRYLRIPANSDFAPGTGEYTVEWFHYMNALNNWPRVFTIGSYLAPYISFAITIEAGAIFLWRNGSFLYTSLGISSNYLNKWIHFAISRIGTTTRLYMNGTSIIDTVDDIDLNDIVTDMYIGNEMGAYMYGTYFDGYITNFHFVKGTGLYSGTTLSIPTSPISAVANTKLLLNASSNGTMLFDASGTNKIVTNNNVTWINQTPFN